MGAPLKDETVRSLRRLFDRYADEATVRPGVQALERLPGGFISEVLDCLPRGVLECVTLPAVRAGDPLRAALRISPDFYFYMAVAAEETARVFAGHGTRPLEASDEETLP